MAWQYSEKTTQLFMDAVQGKPGTHLGEIDDADGFGEHGSIACGDAMRFTFRVKRHSTDPTKDVITDARFRFERGVDPAFVVPGAELATELIMRLCGGEPSCVKRCATGAITYA